MNCENAREILSSLIDGEENTQATQAQEHVRGCAECREWHAGMGRALRLVEALGAETPEIDVAPAVMAGLPKRHPAYARRLARRRARPVLAWLGACWLAGLAILVAIGMAVSYRITDASLARVVVDAHHYASMSASSLGDAVAILCTVLAAMQTVLGGLETAAAGLVSAMGVQLLAFDAVVLLAILLIWTRKRRGTAALVTLA